MCLTKLSLILFILFFPAVSLAEKTCINPNWKNVSKIDDTVGYVSLYVTNNTTIENLICILGSEFFKNVSNFPDKAMVGIINIRTVSGYIAIWSMRKNSLIITKLTNSTGISYIYKNPLKVFESLFSKKDFLKPTKTLTTKFSKKQLNNLLHID